MESTNKKLSDNKIFIIAVLGLITIVACVPLFLTGIEGHFGQDLGFHLNRIEGIVTELKAGHFPVRMESHWMNGYGYPVAIYYGDVLLYIPALLRLMGIGVVSAYKIFVVLITIATALVTYICFKRVAGRRDIALICSAIYTLSSYRLVNVYIRAAVGEYSAFIFFPVILLAMYYIYNREEDKDTSKSDVYKWFWNATILTIGVTGLINTHMLSLEIVGIVLIVFCLVNFRRTFTKGTILTFVIAGIEIVIVNLFYIVPFVDYFVHESVNINSVVNNSRSIQDSGLTITEFFAFFKMPFANIPEGGDDRLLLTPGIVCILILIMGIVYWILRKTDRKMKITIVSVVILLWICSCYFPWNFLSDNTRIGNFLAQVQFPWRYMGIVIILLTLLGAWILIRTDNRKVFISSIIVVVVASLVTVGWFTYEYKTYAKLVTYKTAEDLNSSDMGYIEYLRVGTERDEFTGDIIASKDVTAEEINRNGTDRTYQVDTGEQGGTVTLPIVNYIGYNVTDDNNISYEIYDDDNNLVTFEVPANYHGNMYIRFVWPWYWVVAEIVSLVGIIAIIIINVLRRRNK